MYYNIINPLDSMTWAFTAAAIIVVSLTLKIVSVFSNNTVRPNNIMSGHYFKITHCIFCDRLGKSHLQKIYFCPTEFFFKNFT